MKLFPEIPVIAGLFLLVSACASIEPEPCTAEWVDWQKEQIFDDFAREHRREISALRSLRDDPGQIRTLDAIRMVSLAPDISAMAETFAERTAPSIRSAVARCATTPASSAALLTEFLRTEGVPDHALAWITTLGILLEISQSETRS